jgi:hypothetical protein
MTNSSNRNKCFPFRGLLGAARWYRAELPSDLSNGISVIVGRGELFTVLVIIDHFSGSGLRLSPLSVIIMATSCKLVVSGTFLWPNRPQSSLRLGSGPQTSINYLLHFAFDDVCLSLFFRRCLDVEIRSHLSSLIKRLSGLFFFFGFGPLDGRTPHLNLKHISNR